MPEFISGLPLHPLIVHAVVVLVPLAVLGAVVIAVWPAARHRFGWLVVAAAAIGTALVPVATTSGENLKRRLGENPLVDEHQDLGDDLVWFMLPLLAAVLGLMVLHTMRQRQLASTAGDGPGTVSAPPRAAAPTAVVMIVAAVLTVGLAVAAGVHVYRTGESGSRAVWEFVEDQPPP